MTELTLEMLRAELAPVHTTLEMFRAELSPVHTTLEKLRAELAPMHTKLDALESAFAAMRPNIAGIPMIQRAVSVIQQEQRLLKAAINDVARSQMTAGEAEALHDDVNAVQATHMELETRILELERQVKELQQGR